MRSVFVNEIKSCPWNFSFLLVFKDKEYELYAPTRADREQWIHVLKTIAKMNKLGVKSEHFTPFEWLREQEL